jgi:hypothetical protein
MPLPSHEPAAVAIPFAQLAAGPHATDGPTNALHIVAFTPSHCEALHGSLALPLAHAMRAPCGIPPIGTHVPSYVATSHAAHCPVQGELQQ